VVAACGVVSVFGPDLKFKQRLDIGSEVERQSQFAPTQLSVTAVTQGERKGFPKEGCEGFAYLLGMGLGWVVRNCSLTKVKVQLSRHWDMET